MYRYNVIKNSFQKEILIPRKVPTTQRKNTEILIKYPKISPFFRNRKTSKSPDISYISTTQSLVNPPSLSTLVFWLFFLIVRSCTHDWQRSSAVCFASFPCSNPQLCSPTPMLALGCPPWTYLGIPNHSHVDVMLFCILTCLLCCTWWSCVCVWCVCLRVLWCLPLVHTHNITLNTYGYVDVLFLSLYSLVR